MFRPYTNKSWLMEQHITLRKSTYRIANECSCSQVTICNWIHRLGIPIHGYSEAVHIARELHVDLSEKAFEFLNGLLLGDGHLVYTSKWSSAYDQSSKYKGFLEWISKEFVNLGIEQVGQIQEKSKFFYFRKTGKRCFSKTSSYCSRSYTELAALHSKWYRPATEKEKEEGRKFIKIVPPDLTLTPLVCLMWYLGDGNLLRSGKHTYAICLSTHSYTEKEARFLMYLLGKLGLKTTRWADGITRVSAYSAKNFLRFIGPCPEEISSFYGYRWKYPIEREPLKEV